MTDFCGNCGAVRGIESGNVAEFANEFGWNSNSVTEGSEDNEAGTNWNSHPRQLCGVERHGELERRRACEPDSRCATVRRMTQRTECRGVRPEKVCSLYSTETSVRAPPGYALRQFGNAPRGRPRRLNADRRARTPTLMPGRSLTRPCPGIGAPSLVIGRRGRRAFRYSARGLRLSTFERPSAFQPFGLANVFSARCRRNENSLLRSSPGQLALRARWRYRVCRLLFELRPRPARSSAEQSDRPAVADGRVCWSASPDPRACFGRACYARAPSRDWLAGWA